MSRSYPSQILKNPQLAPFELRMYSEALRKDSQMTTVSHPAEVVDFYCFYL